MPKRKMLINYVPGEECRIALVEDGKLEELYQERARSESHVGNIYKGRITNVEPSIQAAFVDFGLDRNGFLHITDLHPMHFPKGEREELEKVGKKTPHRDRPPIQKCLRRGQEVIVQVLKEGIGTKGPTLTTYLSIPGRFMVMMPNMERHGVSRKVEDEDERKKMRKLLDELDPPDGFGCIVRTAGLGRSKTELKRDMAYLQRLWRTIERRKKQTKVGELYTESDLIIRTLRDVYSKDVQQVIIDNESAARRAHDFLSIVSPRSGSAVVHYESHVPIFDRYGIEQQIDSINTHEVDLPSGGSLIIEQTEALVAIDVNSGKMREHKDAETTAFKTNEEAVDEICRQLRLRDLGGVIVNDLIDMRETRHRRKIEAKMKENLKNDRAKTRVLAINQFGIMAMTRQRMKPSLNSSIYTTCRGCEGLGHIKSPESIVLAVMRQLSLAMAHEEVAKVELTISPDVAFQVLNHKRQQLVELENRYGAHVTVRVHNSAQLDEVHIKAFDIRGGQIDVGMKQKFEEPKLVAVAEMSDEVDEENELADPIEDDTDDTSDEESSDGADDSNDNNNDNDNDGDDDQDGDKKPRRRRRGRRGGRGRGRRNNQDQDSSDDNDDSSDDKQSNQNKDSDDKSSNQQDDQQENKKDDQQGDGADDQDGGKKPRRRRRGRRGGRGRRRRSSDSNNDASDNKDSNDNADGNSDQTSDDKKSDEKNDKADDNKSDDNKKDDSSKSSDNKSSDKKSLDTKGDDKSGDDDGQKKKPRRRRRGSRGGSRNKSDSDSQENKSDSDNQSKDDSSAKQASSGYHNEVVNNDE